MNDPETRDTADNAGSTASGMRARLSAMFERSADAFGAWNARRILRELRHVLDPLVSEVEGGRRARAFAQWYAEASDEQRQTCWLLMSQHFKPDFSAVQAAHEAYEAARGTEKEPHAEVRLRRAFTAPRTRLLQRFTAFPGGLRFLIDLRGELLDHLREDPRLLALDNELRELFATWFDVGFLDLVPINWGSPATLIEKLIQYEAVHDMRSWADARNRLDEDRRCYGFFHPRLKGEPLIFVEVALLYDMASGIQPLLDEKAAPMDLEKASTAIFYSINNTLDGLRGIGFGDELIKRVVHALQDEFPQLKRFATLSPIPGLRDWLHSHADTLLHSTPARIRQALAQELGSEDPTGASVLAELDSVVHWPEKSVRARWLRGAAAHYLGREKNRHGRPLNPVARFHLSNGARVERINWMGDSSAKGLAQSCGLMVNYEYDLKRLAQYREQLEQGRVAMSGAVEGLLLN